MFSGSSSTVATGCAFWEEVIYNILLFLLMQFVAIEMLLFRHKVDIANAI